jgi:hypothetical protein
MIRKIVSFTSILTLTFAMLVALSLVGILNTKAQTPTQPLVTGNQKMSMTVTFEPHGFR